MSASSSTTDHSAVVRAIFSAGWSQGDFTHVQQWLAPSFTFHVHGAAHTMSHDDLRRVVTAWRVGLPDLDFRVHEVVAEGDLVVARATLTGTHLGELRGRPATGNRVAVDHMFMFRFDGDVAVEVWEVLDTLALQEQLETDPPA